MTGTFRPCSVLKRGAASLAVIFVLVTTTHAVAGGQTTQASTLIADKRSTPRLAEFEMTTDFHETTGPVLQYLSTSGELETQSIAGSTDMEGDITFNKSPQHPLAIAAADLYKYGMTILFIFGSVGNFLAIAVLLRKRLRNSSGSLYLIVLGFMDQCNIFAAVLGSHVIRSYTGFDYIRYHRGLCKFAYFTIVACAQAAFYLIAAMSLERAIVVSNPLRHMNTFTRKRTGLIIVFISMVWIVKNLEKFWSMGAIYGQDENGTMILDRECGITAGATFNFSIDIRPWLDYVITFLAALIIIVCNIVIIVAVNRSGRLQKHVANVKDSESGSKVRQMIPMLVTTSLCFLVLALPLQIVTIIYPTNPNDATTASAGTAKLLWSFGLLTSYMNNGVNFYVYCVSGRLFRKELKDMFHCRSTSARDKYKSTSQASGSKAQITSVSTVA